MEIILTFRLLIWGFAILAVAEAIVSLVWLPIYFRHGIQIYQRVIIGNLDSRRDILEVVSCSNTGFLFRKLSATEIGFRAPLISFSTTPVMHGYLYSDHSKVQIRGLSNWAVLSFQFLVALFGAIALLEAQFLVLALPFSSIAYWFWCYQRQQRLFDDLLDELTANLTTQSSPAIDS